MPDTTTTAMPVVITKAKAAKILLCSEGHIHNLIHRGELRAFRLGRSVRIPLAEIEALVEGRK